MEADRRNGKDSKPSNLRADTNKSQGFAKVDFRLRIGLGRVCSRDENRGDELKGQGDGVKANEKRGDEASCVGNQVLATNSSEKQSGVRLTRHPKHSNSSRLRWNNPEDNSSKYDIDDACHQHWWQNNKDVLNHVKTLLRIVVGRENACDVADDLH